MEPEYLPNLDLLVIGNGFDLNIELETSYLNYLSKRGSAGFSDPLITFCERARTANLFIDENWNSFEKAICHHLNFYEYIFGKMEHEEVHKHTYDDGFYGNKVSFVVYKFFGFHLMPLEVKKVCKIGIASRKIHFCSDIEGKNKLAGINENNIENDSFYVFFNLDVAEDFYDFNYLKKFALNDFESNLCVLEKDLFRYINSVTNPILPHRPVVTVNNILSFNYSKTAQKLFEIDNDHTCYIHGCHEGDVILGVDDGMIEDQLFTKNSDYFKFYKEYKRCARETNYGLTSKIFERLTTTSCVCIFGHSLDKADATILSKIFNLKVGQIIICYYGKIDEYKQKLFKIIGTELYEKLNENKILQWEEINKNFELFIKYIPA